MIVISALFSSLRARLKGGDVDVLGVSACRPCFLAVMRITSGQQKKVGMIKHHTCSHRRKRHHVHVLSTSTSPCQPDEGSSIAALRCVN